MAEAALKRNGSIARLSDCLENPPAVQPRVPDLTPLPAAAVSAAALIAMARAARRIEAQREEQADRFG